MRRDWSALPTILDVPKRLPNDADYANFRLVCTSWLSAAPKRPELPRLLVQYLPRANSSMKIHNIPDGELYSPQLPEDIARDKYICGSSRGWIALLEDPPGISLHNPCTGAHIRLPLLTHLPERPDIRQWQISDQGFALIDPEGRFNTGPKPFQSIMPLLIDKIVLSSDPMDEKCVAMALFYYGGNLMHCRPGDAANHWVGLSHPLYEFSIEDMIFYNGQFYAVSKYRMFVCSTGSPIEVTEIPPADPLFPEDQTREELQIPSSLKSYIVVSSGNLLLVTIQEIISPSNPNPGHHCEVFRVGLDGEQLRLYKLENLGGRSLFLCKNSMSFSGENSPFGETNCIYFPGYIDTRIGTRLYGPFGGIPIIKREKRMKVYSMADGISSCISGIVDNCWRAFWLTPSLRH